MSESIKSILKYKDILVNEESHKKIEDDILNTNVKSFYCKNLR